ncbi:MAG TPA: hypothetical protein VGO45_11345 [Bacteroidia bacterium]|jgi:hypothetical protein|nr:hypothetical protein [Bacteroidia bacterium]
MSKLSPHWITEKHIDFEYKKYMLLAWLQEVDQQFDQVRLYPPLAELVEHYRNAKALKENKQQLSDSFSQRMQGLDMENMKILFDKISKDDRLMEEIENILEFSLPRFLHYLGEGKKIYELVEKETNILPVGLVPLRSDMGYLFLRGGQSANTEVYEYEVSIFEQPEDKYRALHTTYVTTYTSSFIHTYVSIKTDLIRANAHLPNPAVYAVETGMDVPFSETFLPVAKRMLMRTLSTEAALRSQQSS